MSADFASVRNVHELAVFRAVATASPRFPGLADDADLLADAACVALNRLPAHYIRHDADFSFFRSDAERLETERRVNEVVETALGFVQAREAMRARG
jgi:hypothetical protein